MFAAQATHSAADKVVLICMSDVQWLAMLSLSCCSEQLDFMFFRGALLLWDVHIFLQWMCRLFVSSRSFRPSVVQAAATIILVKMLSKSFEPAMCGNSLDNARTLARKKHLEV